MKRIDSVNARPNVNGTGKTGFSDNADLSGQDATYLTPDWLNHLQEEICNLIELNGISLNGNSKQQLFDLLTTQSELVALSDAIESNFIRNSQKGVAGGVTPLNVRSLVDSAYLPSSSTTQTGIVQLVNDLTTGGTDKALSAEQGKLLLSMFTNSKLPNGHQKLPNGLIVQWGNRDVGSATTALNIAFPNAGLAAVLTAKTNSYAGISSISTTQINHPSSTGAIFWIAIGH